MSYIHLVQYLGIILEEFIARLLWNSVRGVELSATYLPRVTKLLIEQ